MGDSDRSTLISEFCKVTGADAVRAQHYLEASGWDHNLAISSYFEESEELESSSPPPSMFPRPGSPKPQPKPKAPTSGGSRIATFASLRQNQAESDEEEGQAFYAGGSERSGQQVLGPSKRKAVNEIVQDMFKAVKTFGTEVDHSKKSSGGKIKAFRGTGYVLGSTPNCSDPVPDEGGATERSEPLDIALRLWQSGFTVDDGPIREYSDPQNRDFLDTVRKGEIPIELRHKANGGEVHVKLEDHSHDEYVSKKPIVQAFAGTGFRLGNVAPTVTSPSTESAQKTQGTESDAQRSLDIDDSKPATNLQIRLADGSRLTMRANHTHTIGAVRRFIVEARPEYATMLFSLLSSFPPKELMDDNATLEEENLINSVVVQKIKK